jgi:nitroimidazol reductase NimA-like FMN-containing flavoprotein (pyridoxamine 5'-phosphate oxidase superfamily)
MHIAAPLSPTPRSTVQRARERASSDRSDLYALLDSCLICHLAVIVDGAPLVLPTGYGRDGDMLYLHGSTGSASLRAAGDGVPVSVAVTRVDGIVYGRSVFHHSMNYTSAVIHGTAAPVLDDSAKLHALEVLTEHLAPGSWTATRRPSGKELAATSVLALSLHEASVKQRSGPPKDEPEDVTANPSDWAGVLPLHRSWGTPQPDPLLIDHPLPDRITNRQY